MRKGPFIPTLRVLHKYPDMMPRVQVDRGAIPFLMKKGANCMCPGLTHPVGGFLPDDLKVDSIVAVYAQGKTHALGIGMMKMTSQAIKRDNRGIAMDNLHYLGDGLWDAWQKAAPSEEGDNEDEDW